MIFMTPSALGCQTTNILYKNILKTATLEGTEANLADDETWSSWTGNSVTIDNGSAVECNGAAIVGHTLATDTTTVVIQYSTNGTTWTNAHSVITPTSDEDIFILFGDIVAQYWRILIGSGPSTISCAMIGKRLVMPVVPVSGHKPLHHSRKYDLLINDSIDGQMLGNRVNKMTCEGSVDFGLIDRDFAEVDMAEFEQHYNEGRTFMYAAAPAHYPKDMGYCVRNGDELAISWEEGDYMASVSMGIKAYVG